MRQSSSPPTLLSTTFPGFLKMLSRCISAEARQQRDPSNEVNKKKETRNKHGAFHVFFPKTLRKNNFNKNTTTMNHLSIMSC